MAARERQRRLYECYNGGTERLSRGNARMLRAVKLCGDMVGRRLVRQCRTQCCRRLNINLIEKACVSILQVLLVFVAKPVSMYVDTGAAAARAKRQNIETLPTAKGDASGKSIARRKGSSGRYERPRQKHRLRQHRMIWQRGRVMRYWH